MEVNADEESSLFQPFTMPTVASENVNKTNDPINIASTPLSAKENDHDDGNEESHQSVQKPQTQQQHEQLDRQPNPVFEEYAKLPLGLRYCIPNDLIGTPIEDVDTFYDVNKTFIVVNRNKQLFRFSSANALWLFNPLNALRLTAIRLLIHPNFARFMIAAILIDCCLHLFQVHVPGEPIFIAIYSFEFLIKIIARGFALTPFTYLRNSWHQLDLFLLLTAYIFGVPNSFLVSPYLSELRILKIIPYSSLLRHTVRVYRKSCLALASILLFIFGVLAVCATLGLQTYMGVFRQNCIREPPHSFSLENRYTNIDSIHPQLCGNASGSLACPDNYVCQQSPEIENPNYGITSFDTIYASFLTVFRLAGRDYWEEVLHNLIATTGPWHIVSFVFLIIYCSFQLVSLIWGQIAVSYKYLDDERWEQELLKDLDEPKDASSERSVHDKNTSSCWAKTQKLCFNIIYSPYGALLIIVCILLNTLCMALDHHDMTYELDRFLRTFSYVFDSVFIIEATLKIIALGPYGYFSDGWNRFDFIIISMIPIELGLEGVSGLSVLRSLRLLRPLRLARVVPEFELLLVRLSSFYQKLLTQTILLAMTIYIFTVFGCREFGANYKAHANRFPDGELPRWNFTDIFHSFMTVFRALCGEWFETFTDCFLVNGHASLVYYVALVIVGGFAVMHLFVAMLLLHTPIPTPPTSDTSDADAGKKSAVNTAKPKFNLTTFLKDKLLEPNIKQIHDKYERRRDVSEAANEANNDSSSSGDNGENKTITVNITISSDGNDTVEKVTATIPTTTATTTTAAANTTRDTDETTATVDATKWTEIQRKVSKFNENDYYQLFVTAIILVASVTLAISLGIHARTRPSFDQFAAIIEYVFIIVMIIENLSKFLACGWKEYIKNVWCLIDLFNTLTALLCLSIQGSTAVLLAFRPISLVSRCAGLKTVAVAVARQSVTVSKTLLLCGAFWIIFAIMGVQMFAGQFYKCVNNNGTTLPVEFAKDRQTCLDKNYQWVNAPVNFDNVFNAYFSLLEVASFKGWIGLIYDAVDARGIDRQPMREANIYMFWYFVLFITFAVFLTFNIVVSILLHHCKNLLAAMASKRQEKSACSDSSATAAVNGTVDNDIAPSTESKAVKFIRSSHFEKISYLVCLAYIISLMFDHYQQSARASTILDYINSLFGLALNAETVLRWVGAGAKNFFKNGWNIFDLVTSILFLVEIISTDVTAKYIVSTSFLRVIRIARIKRFETITMRLCSSVLHATQPIVCQLLLLFVIITSVYAIIGIVLFGQVLVIFDANPSINFQTFEGSFITLFQISTGAGWDGVYEALTGHRPQFVIIVYLLTYLYFSIAIYLNIMMSIILEYYREATECQQQSQLAAADLNDFNQKWQRLATNDEPKFIAKTKLKDLVNSLSAESALRLASFSDLDLKLLGIPERKIDSIHHGDVLIALNRHRVAQQAVDKKWATKKRLLPF